MWDSLYSFYNRLVETIVEKLRHAKTMMVRCKLLELLRKIVTNHQVDHSFIAEEIFKQIHKCGECLLRYLLLDYSIFDWFLIFFLPTEGKDRSWVQEEISKG